MTDSAAGNRASDGVITVRLWAGARAAVGRDAVSVEGVTGSTSVATVLEALTAQEPPLAAITPVCTVLRDGHACSAHDVVVAGDTLELLPPFAGG
ncbi:MAG: MoaD/ThiS family protein [Nostocoides sp.]